MTDSKSTAGSYETILFWLAVVTLFFSYPLFRHFAQVAGEPKHWSALLWWAVGTCIALRASRHPISFARFPHWGLLGLLFAIALGLAGPFLSVHWISVVGWAIIIGLLLNASQRKNAPLGWSLLLVSACPFAFERVTQWTSQLCLKVGSRILDSFGCFHQIVGDTIYTASGSDYPIEATSPFSPYGFFGSAMLLLLFLQGSRIVSGIGLAVAGILSAFGAAVRIPLVGFLDGNLDVPNPWSIDLAATLTLLSIFVATYIVIRIFFSPIPVNQIKYEQNWMTEVWNRITGGGRSRKRKNHGFDDGGAPIHHQFLQFLRNWYTSIRPWKSLVAFTISIAVSSALVWLATSIRSGKEIALTYREAFQSALDQQRLDDASRLDARLQTITHSQLSSVELASAYYQSNQIETAVRLMTEIASRDTSNSSVQANLFLAYHYSRSRDLDKADSYFKKAISLSNNRTKIQEVYFRFLMDSGRTDEAVALLEQLATSDQSHRLAAMLFAQSRGDMVAYDIHAQRAEEQFKSELASNNRIESRVGLAVSQLCQRKFELALETAKLWPRWDDNEHLREMAMLVLCVWCEDCLDDERELLKPLRQAIALDPMHPLLLSFLARQRYSGRWENASEISQLISQRLSNALSDDSLPSEPLVVMGSGEAQRGNFETAEKLLRRAYKISPGDSRTLNNLAWTILQQDSSRVKDSLAFVNKAIEIEPRSGHALATRAEIHLTLSEPEKAIDDFEAALRNGRVTPEILQSLSDTYASIGMTRMAQAYQGLARRKRTD